MFLQCDQKQEKLDGVVKLTAAPGAVHLSFITVDPQGGAIEQHASLRTRTAALLVQEPEDCI